MNVKVRQGLHGTATFDHFAFLEDLPLPALASATGFYFNWSSVVISEKRLKKRVFPSSFKIVENISSKFRHTCGSFGT